MKRSGEGRRGKPQIVLKLRFDMGLLGTMESSKSDMTPSQIVTLDTSGGWILVPEHKMAKRHTERRGAAIRIEPVPRWVSLLA